MAREGQSLDQMSEAVGVEEHRLSSPSFVERDVEGCIGIGAIVASGKGLADVASQYDLI